MTQTTDDLPVRRRRELPADTRRALPVVLPVLFAASILVAGAAAALARNDPGRPSAFGIVALLLAAILAEAFPVPIEGVAAGRTSLANIFIVAAGVIYGWAPPILVGFGTMAAIELARRRPAIRIAYNTGLYTLAAAAAGGAAATIRGSSLLSLCLAALAGSAAFYVVDIALLSTVLARTARRPFVATFARSMISTAAPFAIMASLAVILVSLWNRSPLLALPLVGPLVAIALYQRWIHAALERSRELDRLKSEFIAVVSHELRTPLASVYGAAQTLQRRELTGEQRDSLLGVIYSQSARLAHLVDQVLWASRLGAGGTPPTIESWDAGDVTSEVVEAARVHLPPAISLEVESDEALPPVAADRGKLQQVLVNLIENAIKYSPQGGRVRVGLESGDGSVRFSVRDEGLGIPEEEKERIFDKFHRLDPNHMRGGGGTGLGLYICRELVEQMDGQIWVDSREGEGSTFTVELPMA